MFAIIFYGIFLVALILDIKKVEDNTHMKINAREHARKTMLSKCPNCGQSTITYGVSSNPVGAVSFANQYMMTTSIQNSKVNTAICNSCGNNWNYYTEQDIKSFCDAKIRGSSLRILFIYTPIAIITFIMNY